MLYWVYILLCSDGRFYVGHTSDHEQRIARHNQGRGALFTAVRRPISLVYSERFESENNALSRELQIKRWTHAKKRALIDADARRLRELSKSRDHFPR